MKGFSNLYPCYELSLACVFYSLQYVSRNEFFVFIIFEILFKIWKKINEYLYTSHILFKGIMKTAICDLTCYTQVYAGNITEVTIFKWTMVWSIIRNTDIMKSESHFTLPNGCFHKLCAIHIFWGNFFIHFMATSVKVNSIGTVTPKPLYLQVLCTLWWGQLAAKLSFSSHCSHQVSSGSGDCPLFCRGKKKTRINLSSTTIFLKANWILSILKGHSNV